MQADGSTYRTHLEAVAKRNFGAMSATAAKELVGPELPEEAAYLWEWFCELHVTRRRYITQGEKPVVLPEPIDWAEVQAWCVVRRTVLLPCEIDLIRALDAAWLAGPEREGGG